MSHDFVQRRNELQAGFGKFAEGNKAVAEGFFAMHGGAMAEGELSTKTKELMALAISIAVRCDGCIAFHVSAALEAGATPAEVTETVGVAVLMGGGPAMVYGSDAITALEQFMAAAGSSAS